MWTSDKAARYGFTLLWLLALLSAVVWTIVGSVGYWARKGWLPPDTAGWAQAIGAIVAIVVAIAIPFYQSQLQMRQKEGADLKQRLDGISATYSLMSHFSGNFRQLAHLLRNDLRGPSPVRESLAHELRQSAAMLREIPVTALSNEMVQFLVGLREVSNYGELIAGSLIQHPRPLICLDTIKRVQAQSDLIDRWMLELGQLSDDIRHRYRLIQQ